MPGMTTHGSANDADFAARKAVAHRGRIQVVGLVFVTIWFFCGGLFHLFLTDLYVSITPDWVPLPQAVVLATGVLEIIGAAALWHARTRWPTGVLMMIFAVCVTPVHVEMLQQADRYAALGQQALWGRLLFQPVLIVIIFLSTRPHSLRAAPS
jgi:uncharacterized membrane protein